MGQHLTSQAAPDAEKSEWLVKAGWEFGHWLRACVVRKVGYEELGESRFLAPGQKYTFDMMVQAVKVRK